MKVTVFARYARRSDKQVEHISGVPGSAMTY
jgi:hypothetical protein